MTVEETQMLLRSHGWSPLTRKRYNDRLYLYAARMSKQIRTEVYIAPMAQLEFMTPEMVLAKLPKTQSGQ